MFKWNRVLVAIIGVPLLVFIYTNKSLVGIPLLIFTLLIVGIGLYEFYDMVKKSGREVYSNFGIITGLITVVLTYLKYISKIPLSYLSIFPKEYDKSSYFLEMYLFKISKIEIIDFIIFITILLFIYRIFKNQIKGTLEKVSFTLLGVIYVAVFFSQILKLYFYDYYVTEYIINLILYLQILVWVSDTSAGIVGSFIGRKFFKNGFTEISPKKSVEGAIGSLIFTGIASIIIAYFTGLGKEISVFYLIAFILGVLISLIAQIGDLVESLFKRECGVKDSGTILMGHGGILDRFDSMIFVLPFMAILTEYFF